MQHDYNVMSEHGVTDQEYVDQFGLPQALVGKPEMNEWMINKVYEDNIRDCTEGMEADGHAAASKKECKKAAEKNRTEAKKLLHTVKKRRGY
jgi:hypothetical protein